MAKEKLLLIIEGDTNDADYVTQITEDFDPKDLKRLRKITNIILEFDGGYNWEDLDVYKDKLTEEEIDWFIDLAPSSGDQPVHTITSVTVYKTTGKVRI